VKVVLHDGLTLDAEVIAQEIHKSLLGEGTPIGIGLRGLKSSWSSCYPGPAFCKRVPSIERLASRAKQFGSARSLAHRPPG
jgi:hypothetical protein